jgi:hypothetical protein
MAKFHINVTETVKHVFEIDIPDEEIVDICENVDVTEHESEIRDYVWHCFQTLEIEEQDELSIEKFSDNWRMENIKKID